MKILNLFLFILLHYYLASCDAHLMMAYSVENHTEKEICLFIPYFPKNGLLPYDNQLTDTFLMLTPNQAVIVGINTKIDFPWASKNIYRSNPGICGIQLIESDSRKEIPCSKKEWKYKRGASRLIIR